ncbi:unnamed protein product [Schistosoma curassoni]|uniref:Uncharacterized protein n=1 Tax=Schistosoma curassoni TaxID=6186 RepID=A0A183JTG6_9TREM|nr:unnamed protein product [Schistosoma curassoni]
MMRLNAPYDLFIRISLILNLFSVFCTCYEICKQPEWKNFTKLIFKNESYRYVSNQLDANSHIQSHHYHYSQTISLNQPHPDVNGCFNGLKKRGDIQPQFPWKYFETQVSKFRFYRIGYLDIFENNETIGEISNALESTVSRYRLIGKELMAFKWSADTELERTRKSTNMKPAHLDLHRL